MRLEPKAKPDHVLRVNSRLSTSSTLLVGLGVQELSMSPPAIVHVKAALHKHTLEHWRQPSHELLRAETAVDMQSILQTIA